MFTKNFNIDVCCILWDFWLIYGDIALFRIIALVFKSINEDISLAFPGDYLVLLRSKANELKGANLKNLTCDYYLSANEFAKLKKLVNLSD